MSSADEHAEAVDIEAEGREVAGEIHTVQREPRGDHGSRSGRGQHELVAVRILEDGVLAPGLLLRL